MMGIARAGAAESETVSATKSKPATLLAILLFNIFFYSLSTKDPHKIPTLQKHLPDIKQAPCHKYPVASA